MAPAQPKYYFSVEGFLINRIHWFHCRNQYNSRFESV